MSVAGITTAIVCDEPDLDWRIGGPATRFLVERVKPDVTLHVGWRELSQHCRSEKVFDSGALWQLHREDDRLVFRFTSPVFGGVPYKTARVTSDFAAGEIWLHRPYFQGRGPVYPLEYPLDELLIINVLGQGKGVELHGCGVVDRSGAGYLFAGQSGAGKTTMARLWKDEGRGAKTILSDDRVVLRAMGDRIWMYGTPWHGDEPLASPARVPLSHVFFLRHAPRHACAPVNGAPAVARMLACSFLPFHSAPAVEFTLALLEAVGRGVPCHELDFAPHPSVLDFIRREAA